MLAPRIANAFRVNKVRILPVIRMLVYYGKVCLRTSDVGFRSPIRTSVPTCTWEMGVEAAEMAGSSQGGTGPPTSGNF